MYIDPMQTSGRIPAALRGKKYLPLPTTSLLNGVEDNTMDKAGDDLAEAIGGFIDGLKMENAKLKALLKRGLDEFGWMDGPEDWPNFVRECHELLKLKAPNKNGKYAKSVSC